MATRRSRATEGERDRALFSAALDALVGEALVLDRHLRVRAATPAAEAVLGVPIPIGVSAATLLCGDRPERPFAEALAAGTPIQAVIPRPNPAEPAAGEQMRVRAVPLGGAGAGLGWVVHVAAVGGNRDRAAKLLGLSRVTLWRRMRALGIGGE